MAEVSNDFKNGLAAGLSMGKVKVVVGQGGTSDYNDLSNKPSINGVELKGNLTSKDLHITGEVEVDDFLSETSENPVQNKIITAAIKEKSSGGVGWPGTGDHAEIFNYVNNVADGAYSHASGQYVEIYSDYSFGAGRNIELGKKSTSSIALGEGIKCNDNNSDNDNEKFLHNNILIGTAITSNSYRNTIIGHSSQADNNEIVILGSSNNCNTGNTTLVGCYNNSKSDRDHGNTTIIGYGNMIGEEAVGIAIGNNNNISQGENFICIGNYLGGLDGLNGLKFGDHSSQLALGNFRKIKELKSWKNKDNCIYIGGGGNTYNGLAIDDDGNLQVYGQIRDGNGNVLGAGGGSFGVGKQDEDNPSGEIFNLYSGENRAIGNYSHAEGSGTKAMASYAHAEGNGTIAGHYNTDITSPTFGSNAHAEGGDCIAAHSCSHAEGGGTQALAPNSHTEGGGTQALASGAHAEGNGCIAGHTTRQSSLNYYTCDGAGAHAEGNGTIAAGAGSHSGGNGSQAKAECSFAHGSGVVMESENGVCFGINNLTRKDVAFVIGNGNVETSSDALTVDWNGNLKVSGTITDGNGNTLQKLLDRIKILEAALNITSEE